MDGDSQGYPRALFVHPVGDDIICPVCMNVCRDAVVCKDGHSFCKDCLSRAKETNYNKCPMDRSYLGLSTPARNRALDGIISKLLVKCTTTLGGCSGCKWSGPIESLQNHATECNMVIVKCTNAKCCATMYRFELENHTESCPFKTTTCAACTESVVHAEMDNHRSVCLGQNSHCPNNCQAKLTRGQLILHMSNCCPNEIHSCPLKCGKAVTLSEVEEHFKREKDIHQKEILNLLMEERLSLEKQEPITINPIIVEWDVNLGEGDLSNGVKSPRYSSTFAELEIVAKGEETTVNVYLVIKKQDWAARHLNYRNHFHDEFGLQEILAEEASEGWRSPVHKGLHQNN